MRRAVFQVLLRPVFIFLPAFISLPVFIFLGIFVCFQWFVSARIELTFDEAYYWTWARHLSLSYVDHPPMVAWFIALGDFLLPQSELGVRFLGPVVLVVTSILLALSVRDLGGDRRAQILAALFPPLTLMGAANSLIMTPDTPLFLFSTLTLRFLAAIVAGRSAWMWLGVGGSVGLALLSKYTAVVLIFGIFLWLLLMPKRRSVFFTVAPWLGILLALVIFSPVLLWNMTHEWASFAKQGGRVAQPFTASFKTFGAYFGAVIGLATPVTALLMGYAQIVFLREAFVQRSDRSVLLLCLSLPLSLYLLFYAIGHKTEANWALVVAPPLFAMLALSVAQAWHEGAGHVRRLAFAGLVLGGVLVFAAQSYLVLPMSHELGRRDITQRMSGFKNLSQEIDTILKNEKNAQAVVTLDYANRALLSFYLPTQLPIVQLNDRVRYVDFPAVALDQMSVVVGILSERSLSMEAFSSYYERIEPISVVARWHRGVVVESYGVYRLSGFRGSLMK